MRALVLVVAAVGCFSPKSPLGDPCGPDNWCPPPQSCDLGTHICSGGSGGGPDGSVAVAPKVAAASPAPAPIVPSSFLWCDAYPAAVPITIAADEPSTIYYSLDGSTPTTSSPNGASPLALTVSASETVKYFAANSGGQTGVKTDDFAIDASGCPPEWGFVVTNTKLDGSSPVVHATPGQVLHASASFRVWIQQGSACGSNCGAQLVWAIDTTPQNNCMYDGSPNFFSVGTSGSFDFTITAPMTKMSHDVTVQFAEEIGCAGAVTNYTNGTWSPRRVRIGVIIVE